MKKKYLYIFVHPHKTGGTTLNKHIQKNFKKDEVLFLYFDKLGINPFSKKKPDYQKLAKSAVLKLSKSRRDKIKVISGHYIPKGIDRYFGKDRIIRYITIIRNPFEQAKSFYNYFTTLYQREKIKGKDKKLYRSFLKVNGIVPDFDTWLRKKYANLQSGIVPHPIDVYFSDLGYRLEDFYFIGITEKLTQDLAFLFYLLGIKKYFINQNISQNNIFGDVKTAMTYFEKKYPKSMSIYSKAKKINKKFKSEYRNFFKIVKKINKKRKFLTPATQVIFDFVESLHMLSSYARKKSRIYNRLMGILKEGKPV